MTKTHQTSPANSQSQKAAQTPDKSAAHQETGEVLAPIDMMALTPLQINHLQRTIGNRALSKMIARQTATTPLATNKIAPRIQRALPSADDYTPVNEAVGTAVGEYNALGKPTSAPEYQAVFKAMQKVERAVTYRAL